MRREAMSLRWFRMADELGIEVRFTELQPGRLGEWHSDLDLILLNERLTERQINSTLPHEIGHVVCEHRGPTTLAQEREASKWAAWRLISRIEYERAEALYGYDLAQIADELDVMDWVVTAWRADPAPPAPCWRTDWRNDPSGQVPVLWGRFPEFGQTG